MKHKIIITILAVALLGATGCASLSEKAMGSSVIQNTLDFLVPSDFVGDAEVHHKNPQITIDITAVHLRKENGRWVWDELTWKRDGRISNGLIELKPYVPATSDD